MFNPPGPVVIKITHVDRTGGGDHIERLPLPFSSHAADEKRGERYKVNIHHTDIRTRRHVDLDSNCLLFFQSDSIDEINALPCILEEELN